MNFLSTVIWHRTAHCGLQGSMWPTGTPFLAPSHTTHPSLTELQSHGPSFCSSNTRIHSLQPLHFPRTFFLVSSRSWLLASWGSIQRPSPQRSLPWPCSPKRLPLSHHNYIILLVLLHSTHHYLILSYVFTYLFLVYFFSCPLEYNLHKSGALLYLAYFCIPVPRAYTCYNL